MAWRHPSEFKAEAVRLSRESGRTLAQVAQDLGIPEETLRNCRRQAEVDAGRA